MTVGARIGIPPTDLVERITVEHRVGVAADELERWLVEAGLAARRDGRLVATRWGIEIGAALRARHP